ncbi:hypothetical protein DEQ92_20600 [Haloferax sp. Atlit-6N]|uniref:PKD domain-containing protein n=1 Tax=Haloferax sp. Atlit-6N TaxID=2077205 RepID=UPI000E23BF5E|nr:PKD domain-containing protein [Haloferax sp. Atlit-6N]REA00140.1 hypothetical protein DEQ92_20600 [Haloferax sp. Atlit-6N]
MSDHLNSTRRTALKLTGGLVAGSALIGSATAASVSIAATTTSPSLGDRTTFEAVGYNPGGSYTQYSWSIEDADGNDVYGEWGEAISHTFSSPGDYTVYVIASSDVDDSRATAQIDVTVDETVDIEASTDAPSTGETVSFEATNYAAEGGYTQYSWSIDDAEGNSVSSENWGQTLDYSFSNPGVYTVYVIASSDYSGSKATENIKIGVN